MKMAAFKRGVPNAILTVAELFSRNEGYAYGRMNHLRVEGVPLEFQFGRSCYIILAAGVVNVLLGIGTYLLVYVGYCDNISTFFELDYDSPWGCKELEKCMREDRIGCMKRLEEKKGLTNDLNFQTYPYFLGKVYESTEKFEHSLPSYNQATKEVDSMVKQFQINNNSVIVRRNAGGTSEFSKNRA